MKLTLNTKRASILVHRIVRRPHLLSITSHGLFDSAFPLIPLQNDLAKQFAGGGGTVGKAGLNSPPVAAGDPPNTPAHPPKVG